MRVALKLHPDSVCDAVTSIEVHAERTADGVSLHYRLNGDLGNVLMPPLAAGRRDELWRHTCFEAFLRTANPYYEFNLSPSCEWAAYRFDKYRERMTLAALDSPRIAVVGTDGFASGMSLDLNGIADLPADTIWRIGLSAVIEEANGRLSYWALAHPPGKPDFHHPDCFALELPPP